MGLGSSSQSAVDAFVELCESPVSTIAELDDLLKANLHVLNAPSSSGKLALVATLDAGNLDTVHWLLTDPYNNLRINNCGEDGCTALMSCCAAPAPLGAAALTSILHTWGGSLKYAEQDEVNHWSALHYCAYHGATEQAALLLAAEREHVSAALPGLASLLDHFGQSALHVAASRGHMGMLRLLLEQCYSGSGGRSGELEVGVRGRDLEGFSAVDLADASEDGLTSVEEVRDLLLAHETRLSVTGEC